MPTHWVESLWRSRTTADRKVVYKNSSVERFLCCVILLVQIPAFCFYMINRVVYCLELFGSRLGFVSPKVFLYCTSMHSETDTYTCLHRRLGHDQVRGPLFLLPFHHDAVQAATDNNRIDTVLVDQLLPTTQKAIATRNLKNSLQQTGQTEQGAESKSCAESPNYLTLPITT